MQHQYIATNGIHLHLVQDGPPDGPLVILLHGFPEFWYGWRRQIPYLAAAGYRVWAPDQRGYNLSDKPHGIAAYNLDRLTADIVGLIDAAGEEKAILVGHDWGGAVAWSVAANHAQRLAKLVILNVPHGSVMAQNLRGNLAQLRKSWYFFAFQIPRLPEFMARRNNWKMAAEALRRSSRTGTFSEEELEQYRRAWARPNAFRSMLNWYRAMIQKPPAPPASRRISVPTLMIYGAQDSFFERDLAPQSIERCDVGRLVYIEEASHWVQHEEAGRVNALLGAFLGEDGWG